MADQYFSEMAPEQKQEVLSQYIINAVAKSEGPDAAEMTADEVRVVNLLIANNGIRNDIAEKLKEHEARLPAMRQAMDEQVLRNRVEMNKALGIIDPADYPKDYSAYITIVHDRTNEFITSKPMSAIKSMYAAMDDNGNIIHPTKLNGNKELASDMANEKLHEQLILEVDTEFNITDKMMRDTYNLRNKFLKQLDVIQNVEKTFEPQIIANDRKLEAEVTTIFENREKAQRAMEAGQVLQYEKQLAHSTAMMADPNVNAAYVAMESQFLLNRSNMYAMIGMVDANEYNGDAEKFIADAEAFLQKNNSEAVLSSSEKNTLRTLLGKDVENEASIAAGVHVMGDGLFNAMPESEEAANEQAKSHITDILAIAEKLGVPAEKIPPMVATTFEIAANFSAASDAYMNSNPILSDKEYLSQKQAAADQIIADEKAKEDLSIPLEIIHTPIVEKKKPRKEKIENAKVVMEEVGHSRNGWVPNFISKMSTRAKLLLAGGMMLVGFTQFVKNDDSKKQPEPVKTTITNNRAPAVAQSSVAPQQESSAPVEEVIAAPQNVAPVAVAPEIDDIVINQRIEQQAEAAEIAAAKQAQLPKIAAAPSIAPKAVENKIAVDTVRASVSAKPQISAEVKAMLDKQGVSLSDIDFTGVDGDINQYLTQLFQEATEEVSAPAVKKDTVSTNAAKDTASVSVKKDTVSTSVAKQEKAPARVSNRADSVRALNSKAKASKAPQQAAAPKDTVAAQTANVSARVSEDKPVQKSALELAQEASNVAYDKMQELNKAGQYNTKEYKKLEKVHKKAEEDVRDHIADHVGENIGANANTPAEKVKTFQSQGQKITTQPAATPLQQMMFKAEVTSHTGSGKFNYQYVPK